MDPNASNGELHGLTPLLATENSITPAHAGQRPSILGCSLKLAEEEVEFSEIRQCFSPKLCEIHRAFIVAL
jgi:hypothetical protein